jgi:flagellar hook-associated protein 2
MTAPIALSGLASGLDTESIITQLMSVEGAPRNRMALQDSQAASRQTQLKDVQAKLAAVRDAATALRSTTTWADTQALASTDSARISVRALGSAAPGSRQIEVTQLAVSAQHTFDYTASASAQSIQIGAFTLAVDPNSDAGTVAAAINARADAPVNALVAGGKLVFTSRTAGAANDFSVGATALLSENPAYARAGADAAYTVDGVPKTSTSNVISDAVLGVELTLKATTAGPVSVSVGDPGVDQDAVKTKVQAFVTAYNTAVDLIRGKIAEAPVKNAATTTDQLKGLFNGDQMLGSMLTTMRSQIGDLSDLGISTGAASGTAKFSDDAIAGHLTIDATKLSAALTTKPDDVQTRLQAFGLRMNTAVAPAAGSPVDVRLTSEDATRKSLADSMAKMDTRLAAKETRLRAQFAAMESALAAAQAAQSQMSAQLASLG